MVWDVSDDPVDFDEAVAWFRKRVRMTKADFEQRSAVAKRKAFTVANVTQLDLIRHAWNAVDKALKDGTSLEDFKKAVGPELLKAWGESVEDPAWRLETIFRTNVQLAYGAGRHKQATHPDVRADRPIWMFDAILDGRETEVCRECDGTKLPSDDPWWTIHTPPMHFNCRSSFIAMTEDEAGKLTTKPPKTKPLTGFGLPPGDDEWSPDIQSYPAPLRKPAVRKLKKAPPPPPPAQLTSGVHATVVANEVSQADAERMLKSINDAETLKWLKTAPLDELRLLPKVFDGPDAVNGLYDPRSFRLSVSLEREEWAFGHKFEPGEVHSISTSMSTKERAAEVTLRHEMGHHVHMYDGRNSDVDRIVAAAYERARAAERYITKYSKSNRFEYFAESYAAYYHRRKDLKEYDPNGYAMVEDVLKARGILP